MNQSTSHKSILIAVLAHDGDSYCRQEFLQSLENLNKPLPTDLVFISDYKSANSTIELAEWCQKDHGFRKAWVDDYHYSRVGELSWEKFIERWRANYPFGAYSSEDRGYWVPESIYKWNLTIESIVIKRARGVDLARQGEYSHLLNLDADIILETEGIAKLLNSGHAIAFVVYPNISKEVCFWLAEDSIHADEFKTLPLPLKRSSDFFYRLRKYRFCKLENPRNYASGKEIHTDIATGGALLFQRRIFPQFNFAYNETWPCMADADEIGLSVRIWFAGQMTDCVCCLDVAVRHGRVKPKGLWIRSL